LVVLSACETAVSKEEIKGFYISPTNAFLTNRVDAVIGSLWKVPDETTNLLLQEFYNNIEKKGMGNAQALRNAQATVSANPKYNHPFFWSAFVLYGEWR
jgi:CHAT domain-containing protein